MRKGQRWDSSESKGTRWRVVTLPSFDGKGPWKLNGHKRKTPAIPEYDGGVAKGAGNGLLSRELSPGVPSALSGLTTVFGMGTGMALTL
jgi:hypothetical protein